MANNGKRLHAGAGDPIRLVLCDGVETFACMANRMLVELANCFLDSSFARSYP